MYYSAIVYRAVVYVRGFVFSYDFLKRNPGVEGCIIRQIMQMGVFDVLMHVPP
jgi:hypothetical protein